MRFPFLRSERLFSRGQRQLLVEPAEAVATLQAAADAAPKDAQVRLFLGIALADAGRTGEAIAALEAGAALEPASGLFPAEIGVVHLDEGRTAEARTWFAKAAALAPGNELIAAWPLLVRWDEREGEAAAELCRRTRDRAARFQARVLLRTERCFLEDTRPAVERGASPPPSRRGPTWLDRLWDAPRVRRRARASIAKGRFDAAATILLQAREDYEGDELLDGLLPTALEGAMREVTAEIQSLTEKKRAAKEGETRALEAERRDAVFRLADTLLQLERWSEAAVRLAEWDESWRAAKTPVAEQPQALAVAIAAAETAARLKRFDEALTWAERARDVDADRKEVLRAEALARIGRREDRAARRLLERFLAGSLYSAEDRLRELVTGVKAYLAT